MSYIKIRQSHTAEHFDASSVCAEIHTEISFPNESGQVTEVTATCFETSVPRDPHDLESKYKGCSDGFVVFSTVITYI
jgi:hypothetical protein